MPAVTRSGREFLLYSLGQPIHTSANFGDLLHARMEELGDGCVSEDEMELEEDVQEDEAPPMQDKTLPKSRKHHHSPSVGTISDLSDDEMAPSKPKNHHRRYQKQRRWKLRADEDAHAGEGSKATWRKHRTAAEPVHLPNIDVSQLPVNFSGFGGACQPGFKPRETLEELQARGYRHITHATKDAQPLVDCVGRCIGIINCQPQDKKSWGRVIRGLERRVEEGMKVIIFTEKQCCYKRGKYTALNVGNGYGGGRKASAPALWLFLLLTVFSASRQHSLEPEDTSLHGLMDKLLRRRSFKCWTKFLNQIFRTYNPGMYVHYKENMDALYASDASLRCNFEDNIFAALAINFAKQVNTDGHTDDGNLPNRWCSIMSVGNFKHGGQIVLDELKLIIDFPWGTSIYIPSATVTHYTLPVGEDECRCLMTQYSGGGLFRWVYNGFCSDKEWFAAATQDNVLRQEHDRRLRWDSSLKLFPLLNM